MAILFVYVYVISTSVDIEHYKSNLTSKGTQLQRTFVVLRKSFYYAKNIK